MPSKKLSSFIEADRQVKEGEKSKESLKPYITKLLKRAQRLGIKINRVSFSENERFKFDDDALYIWLSEQISPDVLEGVTRKTVDLEKLEELYLTGVADPTLIPESCYTSTRYIVIKIKHL
jgi:hypothetical protein